MSVISSLRQFGRVLQHDWRLSRRGTGIGWYAKHFYRGRWHSRKGLAPPDVHGSLKVSGQPVRINVTAEHLGSLFSVFAEDEYDLRDRLPRPPGTILDLGANTGMAAAYLHAHYPQAAIACVEPDPRNIPYLERTLQENNLPALVFSAAIASEPGELKLRLGRDSTCSALETSPLHDLQDSVRVKVMTVPQVLEQLKWDHIDLLKIDIEGTEDELLSQHNDWLKRVQAIVLEIHPNTTPERIASYLQPFGFTLTPLGRGTEPTFFAAR